MLTKQRDAAADRADVAKQAEIDAEIVSCVKRTRFGHTLGPHHPGHCTDLTSFHASQSVVPWRTLEMAWLRWCRLWLCLVALIPRCRHGYVTGHFTDPAARAHRNTLACVSHRQARYTSGTLVTPETFAEWKAEFEEELAPARQEFRRLRATTVEGKLTGVSPRPGVLSHCGSYCCAAVQHED
jgi:hypothetical protein